MKLSNATTPTEILDVLARRAWYENYEQECPDHQIPTPADLLKWMVQLALDSSGAGKLEPLKLQEVLGLEGFTLSILNINQLWLDSLKTHMRKHPLALLVEAWQERPVAREPDTKRETGILAQPLFGAKDLRTVRADDPEARLFPENTDVAEIAPGPLTVPGETETAHLPGMKPERFAPGHLVYYDRTGAPVRTQGRNGPAPVLQRLFLECMMAVAVQDRRGRVDVSLTLGELVRFLWPHITIGKHGRRVVHPTKTNYDPYHHASVLEKVLRDIGWNCVLETKTVPWTPVATRQTPRGYTAGHFGDEVFFDIRIPKGYGPGPRIHRPTLRKWGHSALAYRAVLSIAEMWNRRITGGGKIAVPVRPMVRRNTDGNMLDHDGRVILKNGRPSTNWNDPRVVKLGGTERNPAMDRLPELSPDELVNLTHPSGWKLKKGSKRWNARSNSLKTLKKMEKEGDIIIERDEQTKGTRILTPLDIAGRMKR